MLEIKTDKYIKVKKILVDGNEWTMKVPGAGDELAMSQATRRIKQLDAKIEAKTATDADYDKYDQLENDILERFTNMFQDGTPENNQVKAWLSATPMVVVQMAIEDIKKQADAKKALEADGQPDTANA